MRSRRALAVLIAASLCSGAEYRLALPGYRYEFPRDHFDHPEFQTEWWYFTGNLADSSGRRFGFELTFFRQGVSRPAKTNEVWSVSDAWLAHFALSDIEGSRFYHTERLNRSGPGLAGVDAAARRIWNGNWNVRWTSERDQELQAIAEKVRVALRLESKKPPVLHGSNGVSQKAAGEGRASHYVSLTRLATTGTIEIEGRRFEVQGLAWMDHEFFTHQLTAEQSGWDWLSLQLDDSTELMLFRLRRKDGKLDPFSAGTFVDAKGNSRSLRAGEFEMTPAGRTWKSAATGGVYPISWRVRIPSLGIDLELRTRLEQQELTGQRAGAPAYWEGAIEASGKPVGGRGYLEMTGYAKPIQ